MNIVGVTAVAAVLAALLVFNVLPAQQAEPGRGHQRRQALMEAALPHVGSRPLRFGEAAPTAPLGAFTLWEHDLLLASPSTTSPFADGEAHFEENRTEPPGRAYLKLWEAFTLDGRRPQPGELCVDLGASPGGWTWVLAGLGARVFSLDKAELAPLPDGVKARVKGCFVTPWRTLQIGRRAVDLINSALILNLNEPSKIDDTSWIRPQKYVGVWWGMHLGTQVWTQGPRHGATTKNALRHIDFAAANNIQGVLFEGWNRGWENWGGNQQFDYVEPYADFDLERIARYARDKGVELWMHNETGGNIPDYEAQMERAMKRYAELGIHTLKTGYAGGFRDGYFHHSQYGVQHYQRVVELAARYGIMLDVHEPIKETGIRRTWPNMMTREGARGMEWNAWSEGNSSEYLCTLPFVRLLSGPMDYTPGIFDIYYDRAKADPGRIQWNGDNSRCSIKTTLARQIANWVIIYSPLQMAADLIENYEGHPAFRFFRDFDANCDWSEALQGEIGDWIVVARRAGERYFLGAGTNAEARTVIQPLRFLRPGVTYTARIYADDPASELRTAYRIEERQLTSADSLRIVMAPDGGCAVTFEPLGK